MTLNDLIAEALRRASAADSASARFATALAVVLRDAERNLRAVVTRAAVGPSTAILRGQAAAKAKLEIEHALTSAGYQDLAASAMGTPADAVAAAVLALRSAAQVEQQSHVLLMQINALRSLHLAELLATGDDLARALWQAVARGLFGNRSVDDILADLAGIVDKTEPQIRTLYDTSVSIFGRQVEALQAGDDPQVPFLYLGPEDEKNRPFCHAHVGKVYTRQLIDQMDNGQIDNVFLTAGGFNCRHSWIEVAKSSELAGFANTNRHVPDFKAAA